MLSIESEFLTMPNESFSKFIIIRSLRLLAKRAAKPRYHPPSPHLDTYDVILLFMTSQGLQMVASYTSSSLLAMTSA